MEARRRGSAFCAPGEFRPAHVLAALLWQGDTLSELAGPTLTIADHRLMLWQLIEARQPDHIAQLEALAGTTQRAAVDYAIEQSGFRDFFPGFTGGRGRPATFGSIRLGSLFLTLPTQMLLASNWAERSNRDWASSS